ncbi:MAG: signal peptide peptidase SppA [Candidatus Brocadiia bacterium]
MRVRRLAAVSALALGLFGLFLVAAAPPADDGEKAKDEGRPHVLELTVEGDVPEQRRTDMPFGPRQHLLRDYTATLRKAAEDPEIEAVILRLRHPQVGFAKVQELADAIREVKEQGKKVYCYVGACGNLDYALACAADRVVAPPGGSILLTGLAGQAIFVKGLLDWAGVEAELLTTGPHKDLGTLTRESLSEENRAALNELLDEVYGQFVQRIAEGRGMEPQQVRETIDRGPFTAEAAKAAGLIDQVAYYDQCVKALGEELGGKPKLVRDYHRMGESGPDLSQLNIFNLFAALKPQPDIPRSDRPKVVVIYASGMIAPGRSLLASQVVTAKQMARAFEKAREEETVKAVVLRVDSPGGSALVSDLIWREVGRTRKAGKPVVASLSDVAGSGGYYIAMGADAIVAQPGSITGSIGVIGGKLVLRGLYEKVGVKKEILTRGKNAALFSDYTNFSDDERERLRALIDDIYEEFVRKAAEGRGMPVDQMRRLATGRVWTARRAKELGLVDELGGLKEAYELAIRKAGIEGQDVQPVILPREKSILEVLFGARAQAPSGLSRRGLPDVAAGALPHLAVFDALARENVLALMPYFIEIR